MGTIHREDKQKSSENPNRNPSIKQSSSSSNNTGGSNLGENPRDNGIFLSPRFKSMAAMAGWDEEAILLATLIVEDTPERQGGPRQERKKRPDFQFKTPPTNSRRKRKTQKRSPASIPVVVLNLDEEEDTSSKGGVVEQNNKEIETNEKTDSKNEEGNRLGAQRASASSSHCSTYSSSTLLPDMDKLREELSCAICLEICFEPSTTTCGHSFCKKCLRSAADKCGKRCPKCRQLISNGRSCAVNTVLWNTIQLLFPSEVEVRKAAAALNSRASQRSTQSTEERQRHSPQQWQHHHNVPARVRRIRSTTSRGLAGEDLSSSSDQVVVADQDDDTALAIRLQRGRHSSPEQWRHHHNPFARVRQIRPTTGPPSSSTRIGRGDLSSRDDYNNQVVVPNQDEDAALAFRLQREEFMRVYRPSVTGSREHWRSNVSVATANLRAMASRAINRRTRR